jgi:hypothetical protein
MRLGRFRLAYGYAIGLLCLLFDNRELFLPGIAVALAGLGFRMWAAGCIEKNKRLVTTGPYALCRNPLYLGSFILGLGTTLAVARWWLVAIYIIGFAAFYWPAILNEEQYLFRRFGDEFLAYKRRVPSFMPWRFRLERSGFSLSNLVRNKELRYSAGAIIFLCLLEVTEEVRAILSQRGS